MIHLLLAVFFVLFAPVDDVIEVDTEHWGCPCTGTYGGISQHSGDTIRFWFSASTCGAPNTWGEYEIQWHSYHLDPDTGEQTWIEAGHGHRYMGWAGQNHSDFTDIQLPSGHNINRFQVHLIVYCNIDVEGSNGQPVTATHGIHRMWGSVVDITPIP
jgi:hypothetical protein